MMRGLASALLLLLPIAACAPQPGPLEVNDVWTRATVGGVTNAAVFMKITSPAADRLIGASSAVAAETDLMSMQADGGAMGMVYVADIDIPANEPVSLDPRGLHVWLAGLSAPLEAGQTFPLVLHFEKAGEREVIVSIIAPTAAPPKPEMDM